MSWGLFNEYADTIQKQFDAIKEQRMTDPESAYRAGLQLAMEEVYVAQEELRSLNEELALRKFEAERESRRYRLLFDRAPEAYLITNRSSTIIEANDRAKHLLGVSTFHLVGKPLSSFVPTEQRGQFRSRLGRCDELELQRWELPIQPRQGSTITTEVSLRSVADGADEVVLCWILRPSRPRLM